MRFPQQDSGKSILYDCVFHASGEIYLKAVKRFISNEMPVK